MTKLANTLRVERAKNRLTQAQLAEKAGISRQALNAIELGKSTPSGEVMLKLARALKTNVEYIFKLI